jgi:flagellin
MDVLGSTGQVELNLFRTQLDERKQVNALASGLRVQTASDDPSGLAIAETIQSKVAGLQQGVQNVQTASNLLAVADGALATVQTILQRIHSLIVEASSDLNSGSQLESIQSEIDSLLSEVNKIAGQANFNGVSLLDGSLSTSSTTFNQTPYAVQVTPVDQGTGSNVYDANNTGGPDPGPMIFANPGTTMYTQPGSVSGYLEFQVIGYSNNPVDPNLGALGQPGVYLKITQYSTDPSFGGTNGAQEQVSISALPTGGGVDESNLFGGPNPLSVSNADKSLNMLVFDLANLSAQDVGVTEAFQTFDAAPASTTSGHALQVNSSGTEGGIVSISLPDVSTLSLGIGAISVLDPTVVDWQNNITGTGSNAIATADAEGRVQNALDAISQARAQVGAQTVALQEDSNDASLQIVNQIASESAIRDVNIGQAATAFTKDQVLTQIDSSVQAQLQADAKLVVALVSGQGSGLL